MIDPNCPVAKEQLLRLYAQEVYLLRRLAVHLEHDSLAKKLLADANRIRKEIEKIQTPN